MSETPRSEQLTFLPDRLVIAEFDAHQMRTILGEDPRTELVNRESYNWIAAYLVEDVGLHEDEVGEWFKSSARSLSNKRPLDLWKKKDGFSEVFEYAKFYKEEVDKALDEEGIPRDDLVCRSYELAQRSAGIIIEAFTLAGVNLLPDSDPNYWDCVTVWNPEKGKDSLTMRWKRTPNFEEFKINMLKNGERSEYIIEKIFLPGEEPHIFQSRIIKHIEDEDMPLSDSDSAYDGRPPKAAEVAHFVVGVVKEVKSGSLVRMTKEGADCYLGRS